MYPERTFHALSSVFMQGCVLKSLKPMSVLSHSSYYSLIDGLDRHPPHSASQQKLMDENISHNVPLMEGYHHKLLKRVIEKRSLDMPKTERALKTMLDDDLILENNRAETFYSPGRNNSQDENMLHTSEASGKPLIMTNNETSSPIQTIENHIHNFLFKQKSGLKMEKINGVIERNKARYPNVILLSLREQHVGYKKFIEMMLEQEFSKSQEILSSTHWQKLLQNMPQEREYHLKPIDETGRNLLIKLAATGNIKKTAGAFYSLIGVPQNHPDKLFSYENRFLFMTLIKASETPLPISLIASFLNLIDDGMNTDYFGEYYTLDKESAKLFAVFYATTNRYGAMVELNDLHSGQNAFTPEGIETLINNYDKVAFDTQKQLA